MKTIRVLFIGCLVLTAPLLFAQNNILNGNFPFNETITIVQQPAVNGACGTTLSGPVTSAFINDTGIWSFDGKGKVSITDSGLYITSNPPTDASQVVPEHASCSGTYSVSKDLSTVDFHYNCSTDGGISYFQVHTTGRITLTNILVEAWLNPDGSLPVIPYVYRGVIAGCSYLAEDTVVSLEPL
jgi:hypothetical protein